MTQKVRILLVDDEETILDLMSVALTREGYEVATASDGAKAVARLAAGHFDVAVMDIMMPAMDGITALGELKKLDPELEVIMATGHGDMSTAIQSLRKGAFDYLHKPYQLKDLLAAVEKALEKRRFNDLTRAIFSTIKTGELLPIVLDSVTRALKADEAALLLERGGKAELAEVHGIEDGARAARAEFCAAQLERLRGDGARLATLLENPPEAPELKSVLLLPVMEDARLGGLIAISRRREDFFTEDDLQRAKVFGSLANLALRNAKLYAQLQDTQAQLVQAGKMSALGQLAGGVAHEINNPLSGILGLAQLALEAVPAGTQTHADLKEIEKAVFRCKKIVSSLLSFARQEKAKLEPLSVNEAVEETLVLFARQLELRGIKIEKDLSPELPRAAGDFQQLMQVFLNLFTNARDAMPDGGTLAIRTRPADGGVEAAVSDTGAGIPRKVLERVFDPFFTTKPAGKGTGLGLSVCMGIMKRHGGRIEAESEEGRGSTFRVFLPAAD